MANIPIGSTLRTIRASLDLTQQQLADRLGVSFTTVNRWEGGVTAPQRAARIAINALAAEAGIDVADVQPDFLGRAYEYLLRKFAEGFGQSAGEFFTPTKVGFLMAHLMRPRPGEACHDYACGSARLQLVARELDPTSRVPLKLYGQELQAESYAVAHMNAIIHDMDVRIERGDTMINPKFKTAAGRIAAHDVVVANPMWNQDINPDFYTNDPFDRFHATGGVILLPDNLFYNTSAAGAVVVLSKRKPEARKNRIVLLNASRRVRKGRPKNFIPEEDGRVIAEAFATGEPLAGEVAVITREQAAGADYNLSPSRWVEEATDEESDSVPDLIDKLRRLSAEIQESDRQLFSTLEQLR